MTVCTKTQLAQLTSGLAELNIFLEDDQLNALIQYLNLLSKWNKTYNLTAITEPSAMVTQHLLDSLAIQPYLKGHYLLDVGTGAGLPGIPLAIANSDKQFTLLDSLNKRTKFLLQAVYELKLSNVTVINARVEDYQAEVKFDQIISRAFASISQILQVTQHLQTETSQVLAMKGANFAEELEEIVDTYTIVGIHRLKIPGSDAKRHLIILEGSYSG